MLAPVNHPDEQFDMCQTVALLAYQVPENTFTCLAVHMAVLSFLCESAGVKIQTLTL